MDSNNGRSLQTRQWDEVIESDASLQEWGASSKGVTTGGPWTREEAKSHINPVIKLGCYDNECMNRK